MAKDNLGKLKSLGVPSLERVAFLLPKSYTDLRNPIDDQAGVLRCANDNMEFESIQSFSGHMVSMPQLNTPPGQSPRMKCRIILKDKTSLNFMLFETYKVLSEIQAVWAEEINRNTRVPLIITGVPTRSDTTVWINRVKIQPNEFLGKIVPIYPGKTGVIKPETTRSLVTPKLDESIPQAAEIIRTELSGSAALLSRICDPSKLEMVLKEAHHPSTMKHADRANHVLDMIAALVSRNKLTHHALENSIWSESSRLDVTRWQHNTSNMKFELTSEQVTVINSIALELNKAISMRGMLQGDVGSGKTIVFGLLAITAALSGKKVSIMLPNTALAAQVYHELSELMSPEHRHMVELVTGDVKKPQILGKNLIIGTTAILFAIERDHPGFKFDLSITDEQQKYSRKQRNQLLSETTHSLEVSATPIPRSVALAKFGAVKVWRLKQAHTDKKIESMLLRTMEEGKQGLKMVYDTINQGNQAILVYALKEDSESEVMEGIVSAEKAYSWWETRFPGKVGLVHSNMDEADKQKILNEMKSGELSILVSTTVIEVGVTIPGAMTMIVFNAERFGLVTLHQLRGRLARQGNKGGHTAYFLMKAKDNAAPQTLERLNVMLQTNDGFEIAEKDLALRGYGDLGLNSENQSGSDDSILIGRKVEPKYLEMILEQED